MVAAVSSELRGPTSITGAHAPDWETATKSRSASRPSKSNCTSTDSASLPATEATWAGHWWKQKNAIVDRFLDEMGDRAIRPCSVRDDVKLREECASEKDGLEGRRRSKPMHSILNEFLSWYNGYRHAHLRFKSPDGEIVRAPMKNSHQPAYGAKYYARIKALERQVRHEYDDLHVVMLTFTGSTRNAKGGWRCPADHLRDVVSSWRPNRGRGVYHALRDSLDGKAWEYGLVLEHHKSGYGHVHCAVFVDGEVTAEDFYPAIDAHLRCCEIAHRDAHDYFATEVDTRPISIRKVVTDFDYSLAAGMGLLHDQPINDPNPKRPDLEDLEGMVSNVGSYIAEYIGAYGAPLFERSLGELMFRASCWATGSQMVRFSNGANEMIRKERGEEHIAPLGDVVVLPNPDFSPERDRTTETETKPFDVTNEGWALDGIGRVDETGEEVYKMEDCTPIEWVNVDDASHLDPPSVQSSARPQRKTVVSKLDVYLSNDD